MGKSKAWNWDEVKEPFWGEPAEETYYLASRWKKEKEEKILDLGCGIGRHSIFFAKEGFDVYAYDLSKSGMKKLNEVADEQKLSINTEIGDMTSLPYDSEIFKYILAYHAIYHTDKSGIEKVISEIKRTLHKSGEVFLTFNSKSNPSFSRSTNKRIGENTIIKTEGQEKGIPHYYVDEKEIKRLMKDFEIITLRHVQDIGEGWRGCHYFVLARKI